MRRLYTLDFPNAEVEDSFVTQVVPAYTAQDEDFSRAAQGLAFSKERRTIVDAAVEAVG